MLSRVGLQLTKFARLQPTNGLVEINKPNTSRVRDFNVAAWALRVTHACSRHTRISHCRPACMHTRSQLTVWYGPPSLSSDRTGVHTPWVATQHRAEPVTAVASTTGNPSHPHGPPNPGPSLAKWHDYATAGVLRRRSASLT